MTTSRGVWKIIPASLWHSYKQLAIPSPRHLGSYQPKKMFRAVVISVALAMALAAPLNLDEEWVNFKTHYNKKYEAAEEAVRRLIWESNLQTIQKHNIEADRGEHSFWLGMNPYGDMTTEEFVKVMNGYRMHNGTRKGIQFMAPLNVQDLPDSVDWREKGYVTPVKNQEQCGSCWAFSTTGSLEGQHFRSTGQLVSLSEQNLVDCSRSEGNYGCSGGLMDYAFEYIRVNGGIDTEASYPYTAMNGKCHYDPKNSGATDTGYVDVPRNNEDALTQAIATVGPISVAIDASRTTFHLYKTGVYNEPLCSSVRLDHGVLAVGYGSSNGQDYYLVKNSWGTAWGQDGYIWMSRNKNNQCGIATESSYPTV